MCGIAGAIGDYTQEQLNPIVSSMVSALAHRGPDDQGCRAWCFEGNQVGFGHTRLSIIDLSSAGHQPMCDAAERYWTVFNGEIYNFQEIRRLLDPDWQIFRTASDTEAILHAYDRWSVNAFHAFKGMFALALLDKAARVVHLVRDSLGIKPLYYYVSGRRVLFASEVQALLATGQIPRKLNREAISHFLGFGWVGQTETAIEGVKLLRPGEVLTINLNGPALTTTLSNFEPPTEPPHISTEHDRAEATAHIRHLLEQSMKYHLVSDVPVGLFLSGGIDSTALLHLMRQMGTSVPKTFTVVFPEKRFNESQFAREVARRYGAQHTEVDLAESDLLSQLPYALHAMDQPTMDGVNTYVIAKAVRAEGVKVAISGLGSDELFAGYPSFKRLRLGRYAARVPLALRQSAAAVCRRARNGPSRDKLWDYLSSNITAQSTYLISRRLFNFTEISELLGGIEQPETFSTQQDLVDPINQVSRLELEGYMTGLLLRDTDFMSMASSLEVRVPFVDKTIIRHVLALPGRWKLDSSRPKPLLLNAMRGSIPDYVWNRKKMGFVFPFDSWMRSVLQEQVAQTLCDRALAEDVGLVPDSVRQVWNRFLQGEARWTKPWSLFVLMRWCQRQQATA